MRCGGTTAAKPANEEAQGVADAVRGEAEARAGHAYQRFTVTEYMTQVVAGLNYFLKVDTGDHGFVFLRVYQGMRRTSERRDGAVARC